MFFKKLELGIRSKLILLFTGLLTFTLCLYSFFLIQMFTSKLERDLDTSIYNLAIDMVAHINHSPEESAHRYYRMLSLEDKIRPFAVVRTLIQITTEDGVNRFRSKSLGEGSLPFPKARLGGPHERRHFFDDILYDGKHYRMLSFIVSAPPHEKVILQLAAPMTLLHRESKNIIWFFTLTIPFVVLAAAFGGWVVSKGALGPVQSISRKAKSLTSRNLGERVPVPAPRDEIRELAETLNGLLDRLEDAFRSQDAFVANASHQLKTPLAILRGEIDLMRNRVEGDDFLECLSSEVNHLTHLTEDLLTLARLKGAPATSFTDVPLEEILFESFPNLEKLASKRGQTLRLTLDSGERQSFTVFGDAGLLQILEENLIENALKYSPDGSVVSIDLSAHSDGVKIAVTDEGDGIDPSEQERVFERFYRGKARSNAEGTGLGLAIAKEITMLHDGHIAVESPPGKGATFHATLPRRGIKNL